MAYAGGIRETETDIVKRGEDRPGANFGGWTLVTIVLVVAVLYYAREVFIPLAMAVLFAFLLAPLAIRLRYWGLGRAPSSIIVVLFSFCVVSVIGAVLASQMTDLGRKLPGYQQNVRDKLHSIRASGGGVFNRVSRTIHNITDELIPAPTPSQPASQPAQDKPVPVEIHKAPPGPLELVQKIAGSLFTILLNAVIVVVLVIFILIQREDLRDRVIRLLGASRINITTQALDDAAGRLGRYLLAQLLINLGFGFVAGSALYFMGVPDPILWGIMAALLRYIPYLGIWIAAALPALIIFAVDPGWIKVPLVFGIYFGIDLLIYNLVEPFLYGNSTGVSPLAILLAALFWTWLWGPVGLLLAVPLTVCVVVIGRYFPSMEFLEILLSDKEVLSPETRFYQRMLAMDLEAATEVAEQFGKGKSIEELEDRLIVPALIMAEEERHRGRLDEEHQRFLFQNTRMLIEELAEAARLKVNGEGSNEPEAEASGERAFKEGSDSEEHAVVCIPARDEADEIAAEMIAQLLEQRGTRARVLSAAALAGECLEEIRQSRPRVACIVAVPPFGHMHVRYLCRRLRSQFPDLKIVAAILTEKHLKELRQREPGIPADEIGISVRQALTAVLSLVNASDEAPLVAT